RRRAPAVAPGRGRPRERAREERDELLGPEGHRVVSAPELGASDLAAALRARELSCEEVARTALERIRVRDGDLGSFLAVDAEVALARARSLDRELARGRDPGPLAGVPVAVKDMLLTRGLETTAGSRILRGF